MYTLQIALIHGGISGEREVSLKTGEKIYEALKDEYTVVRYDPQTEMEEFLKDGMEGEFDLVFPALHGPFGEDGKFQGLLEMLQLPYVFSDPLASALAMDKSRSKILVGGKGVPVAHDFVFSSDEKEKEEGISKLGLPVVVKPSELGSSVGITIAEDQDQLRSGIEQALSYGDHALVEEYIQGRELTVTVWGNNPPQALPVIEIRPTQSQWFDYDAKYKQGGAEEICPAQIPEEIRDRIQDYALKAFKALGCRDLARVDFIWNEEEDRIYFLEVNTIPGMTDTSLVPQSAQANGVNFKEFLDKIIAMGTERKNYVQ